VQKAIITCHTCHKRVIVAGYAPLREHTTTNLDWQIMTFAKSWKKPLFAV
jgi:hypothetical protein